MPSRPPVISHSIASSSSSSNCQWKIHLVRQRVESNGSVTHESIESPVYQPLTTQPRQYVWQPSEFYVEEGDVLSLAFERTSSGGGTYYLYTDGTLSLREP